MTDEDAARRLEELLDWIETQGPEAWTMAAKLVPHLGEWAKQAADGPCIELSELMDKIIHLSHARKKG